MALSIKSIHLDGMPTLALCTTKVRIGSKAAEKITTGNYETFIIHTENDIFPDMVKKGTQFRVLASIGIEISFK